MKILLFDNSALLRTNNDYCVENGTGSFAKELVEMGHSVTFYGQSLSNVFNTTNVFPLLYNDIKVIAIKRLKNKLFSYLRVYFLAVKPIIKSDFIYFYYPSSLRFLVFLCIVFNKKYGIYIRGIDDLKNVESNIFYKHSNFVLTVADYFTNYVNLVVKKNIASNIRPMIFLNESDIQWDRTYKLTDTLNILFIGRMSNDKGVLELIHATNQVKKSGVKIKVNLIGDGEYISELKKIVIELKLQEEIIFSGAIFDRSEIIKYHEKANLFILPSHHEGFPRTIYEAMILGTPIITTFVGGISGVMVDRINCYKIQHKSVNSLVETIIYASENYEEFISYSCKAKLDVKNILENRRFSHAEMVNSRIKI